MELLAAEKHQVEALKNMQHQNKSLSMLDEILEDVRKAADRLEEEIEEHAFDDNKSVSSIPDQVLLYLLRLSYLLKGYVVEMVCMYMFSVDQKQRKLKHKNNLAWCCRNILIILYFLMFSQSSLNGSSWFSLVPAGRLGLVSRRLALDSWVSMLTGQRSNKLLIGNDLHIRSKILDCSLLHVQDSLGE